MNQPIRVLLASTRSLLQSLDADSLLRSVMDQILEVTGASRGFLMLRRDDGELLFRVSRDFRQEEIAEPRFSTSRSIIQQVVETGETFLSGDLAGDRSLGQRESIQRLALASVLCVPIPGAGGEEPGEGWPVEGVIYVDNPAELELFHEPAKRLLVEALAALTSLALANLRSAADLEQDNRRLRRELSGRYRLGRLLGRSPVMQELFTRMERILPFHEPVLIVGETGTGKELAARALHFEGPRRQGPFESVNCATLSGSLLEAELFGVSRGAATGVAARAGVIERAHGGTLFLDEVGELSPDVQVKLLRVLELRELTRVGGVRGIPVDIRILSATNRDLEGEVTDGRFRKDLYFRLKGLTLRLPSLTERQEDIPLLAEHFLAEFLEEESQLKLKGFTPQALRELVRHPWEGNVRELRSQVRTAAINEEASRIGVAALAFDRSEAPASNIPCQPQGSLRACLERLERELILRALEECSGVKKEAARRLELSPRALSHYLRKHGIR